MINYEQDTKLKLNSKTNLHLLDIIMLLYYTIIVYFRSLNNYMFRQFGLSIVSLNLWRMEGMRTKKGFTLIEIIVVIAIIGVLASILVPSMIGYVRKSKKTHDMNSGKQIAECVMSVLSEKEKVDASFYSVTQESQNPNWRKVDPVTSETYDLVVVAVMNGGGGCRGDYWNWTQTDPGYKVFVDALNDEMDYDPGNNDINIKIKYEPKGAAKTLNRWFVCYRSDSPGEIEIWVGNGESQSNGMGEPMYRAYPKPAY